MTNNSPDRFKKWLKSKHDTKKVKKWRQSVKKAHAKLTEKVRKGTKHDDLCTIEKNTCKGSLGIPRALMPQIDDKADLVLKKLKKDHGITYKRKMRRISSLKPAQAEIRKSRVNSVIKKMKTSKKKKSLSPAIVSKDGYIIDGHHRWGAYKELNPNQKIEVYEINAPAKEILEKTIGLPTQAF